MGNVITSVPLSESLEYQVYLKPYLEDPLINKLPFDIIVGKMKRDLYFNEHLDKITSKKVACGWTFATGNPFTKKTLEPFELQAPVSQCYIPLMETIFADGLPTGWERGTLSEEVINYMTKEQQYAFNRDLLSILMLGDTSSADPYYNGMDGVYVKLLEGIANNDGTVDANVTLDATTLNATNFFNTMNAVYNAQSRYLRAVPKARKTWIWTQATYELYVNYLEASTQGTAGLIQTDYVINGNTPMMFKGIPIVVLEIVDERLETDFLTSASPASVQFPYRTILTVADNHKILLDGDGFMKQNQWYNPDLDEYRITGSALLAYEYGYGELNVLAGM